MFVLLFVCGAQGSGQRSGWAWWALLGMGTCGLYAMLRRGRDRLGRGRKPGRGDAVLPLVAGASMRSRLSWLGLGGHKRTSYKV